MCGSSRIGLHGRSFPARGYVRAGSAGVGAVGIRIVDIDRETLRVSAFGRARTWREIPESTSIEVRTVALEEQESGE